MMDEFIRWPKPYLLFSPTCDEILSWMIEILISDSNHNTVNLLTPKFFTRNDKKCWVNILVLVTLHHILQLVSSKTIRIGDTGYHIYCTTTVSLTLKRKGFPVHYWRGKGIWLRLSRDQT